MLYTFRAKVAGDILMLDRHARPLLEAAGKTAEVARQPRGVFTPEQLPAAIQALQDHVAQQTRQEEAQAAQDQHKHKHHEDEDDDKNKPQPVSANQRAFPLLDLLRKAEAAGVDVMWETSGP